MSLFQDIPLKQITKTKVSFPVSLDEAKRHLRVDETFEIDDDFIQGLIFAATLRAEQYIGKDIALTNNVLILDDFCSDTLFYDEGNFNSLTSIIDDASISYSPLKTRTFRNGFYLEFSSVIDTDILTISFKTGFNYNQCPQDIKQAILIKISDLYDSERSDYQFTSTRDTKAFERILDVHKILTF